MQLARLFLIAAVALSTGDYVNTVETAAGSAVILEQSIEDDVLIAGQDVRLKARIDGDVAVAGAEVHIEESVAGYVMAAGKSIELNGPVRNDFWAAGASVEVNAPVDDNAMLAARQVNLNSSAAVRGDARIAAETANIDAPIEGDLTIAARAAQIDSEIGGSIDARVQRLRVLPGRSPGAISLYVKPTRLRSLRKRPFSARRDSTRSARSERSWLWWWLFAFAALLTLGFVTLALFPGWPREVAVTISARPGASALFGIAGLLLVPIVAGFLLVTVIGIPVAVILLALYLVAVLLSGVFVSYLLGNWIFNGLLRRDASRWLEMILGVLITSFFISLPWIGSIVQLIVLLVGFGVLVLQQRDSRRSMQSARVV